MESKSHFNKSIIKNKAKADRVKSTIIIKYVIENKTNYKDI